MSTEDGSGKATVLRPGRRAKWRRGNQQAATPDSILIGVTDEDIYIAELDWEFAFNFRETHQTAVISTARLNPVYYGRPAAPAVLETRLRKLLSKNIGISFYGLNLLTDSGSVLYNEVWSMKTLDAMGEDYSARDAGTRRNVTLEAGDPCIEVRHYYSPKKQRTDSARFRGCSRHARRERSRSSGHLFALRFVDVTANRLLFAGSVTAGVEPSIPHSGFAFTSFRDWRES